MFFTFPSIWKKTRCGRCRIEQEEISAVRKIAEEADLSAANLRLFEQALQDSPTTGPGKVELKAASAFPVNTHILGEFTYLKVQLQKCWMRPNIAGDGSCVLFSSKEREA